MTTAPLDTEWFETPDDTQWLAELGLADIDAGLDELEEESRKRRSRRFAQSASHPRRPKRRRSTIGKRRPIRPARPSGLRPKRRRRIPGRRPIRIRPRPRRRVVIREPAAPCVCPAHKTEFVRWVQSSLNLLLGLRLRVNGMMNQATREALRDFQQQQAMPVDGIAGPETEKALVQARARHAGGTSQSSQRMGEEEFDLDLTDLELEEEVQRNSREYIRWVQASLNKVIGSRLAVDGIIGPMTRSAIRSFQTKQGLAVDSIVGPQTEHALIVAGAGQPPGSGKPSSYVPAPTTGSPIDEPDLVEIEPGKYVARQIAHNVRGLLTAARQAGYALSISSAYRSPDKQIALRRQNCGTSEFDIFEKDPKLCNPQTAKPGTSNHEKGLAVDFNWDTGGHPKQWSDPEAQWLRLHAKAEFGLDNKISSEPWHWSINGR